MLKVGITGGIGSGKSTVAHIFSVLGVPVLYADDVAKMLMSEDGTIRQKIIQAFGHESYTGTQLNRHYLAATVFAHQDKVKQLNAIVHPAVIDYGKRWMQKQTGVYALKEAALFFESGSYKEMDIMVGVYAPEALRMQRVVQRDKSSASDIKKRIDRQMPEDDKMKLCHHVIVNDDAQALIPQVLALHQHFLRSIA